MLLCYCLLLGGGEDGDKRRGRGNEEQHLLPPSLPAPVPGREIEQPIPAQSFPSPSSLLTSAVNGGEKGGKNMNELGFRSQAKKVLLHNKLTSR